MLRDRLRGDGSEQGLRALVGASSVCGTMEGGGTGQQEDTEPREEDIYQGKELGGEWGKAAKTDSSYFTVWSNTFPRENRNPWF